MTLIESQLREIWDALRQQNSQRSNILTEARIRNLRGIRDLRVPFEYPVSVLAGPNACGKSTVLFACACAYRVPDSGPRDFVPSTLFPNFTSSTTQVADAREPTQLEFYYLYDNERISMRWTRGKSWNRSFMGRKGGEQPERQLYLRTLANLTNPSEVRSLLQIGRRDLQETQITDDLLIFAHRVLPRRYERLSQITAQSRDLLFAELKGTNEARYSEFHMSSGERVILRISKDISNLQDALILIDEVEVGLHPYTQQQAMLEFQRIALRNKLQIIVASHSPVVLESVPPEARLFLERDEDTAEVSRVPAYRDILQKAFYGQSRDKLSILCEDEVAEGLIRGFMDTLNFQLGLQHEDIVIGRDTGQREFPGHVRALSKFGKMNDFLFVLDGDSRDIEPRIQNAALQYGQVAMPLFLPGNGSPESWIWGILKDRPDKYGELLGVQAAGLAQRIDGIERLVEGGVRQKDSAKTVLYELSIELSRTVPEIARIVGKQESQSRKGEVAELLAQLQERINAWRQM